MVPLLKRMGVAEIIDQHLPVDAQAEFSHGKVLSVLIAARAHKPVALSNIAKWAKDALADVVFGMPIRDAKLVLWQLFSGRKRAFFVASYWPQSRVH